MISENIQVTSIVGRFLEQAASTISAMAARRRSILGSADLMPRNIDRRVETLFPLQDSGDVLNR